MFSLTACTEKEDNTPTFPVHETQDEAQFEVNVEIPIKTDTSTEATENIENQDIKDTSSSLNEGENENRISQDELQGVIDSLEPSNTENIENPNNENPADTKPSNTENKGISSDMPLELKEALQKQNQKTINEGLEIINKSLKN